MKIRCFFILFLPSMLFGQAGFSPLKDHTVVVAGLKKMAAETNTIKTDFVQNKHVSILSEPIVSEGEMLYKKPKSLKWAYTKPYNYVILFYNDEIAINDEGKLTRFDVSSSKAFVEINEIIVNSISGNILDEKQFDINYFESKEVYLAKMVPKEQGMKAYIVNIEVYLDKKDFTVSAIKLNENGGDYTNIELSNKKLNMPLTDDDFRAN